MVTINLLPWREYARIYQIKIMKRLLLGALFSSLLMIALIHFVLTRQINTLYLKERDLKQKIRQSAFFLQKKKNNDLSMEFTQAMHRYQLSTRKLVVLLGKRKETGLCFARIFRERNAINFSGRVRSPFDLIVFLKQWRAAHLFSVIKMKELKQENHYFRFRFQGVEKLRPISFEDID